MNVEDLIVDPPYKPNFITTSSVSYFANGKHYFKSYVDGKVIIKFRELGSEEWETLKEL